MRASNKGDKLLDSPSLTADKGFVGYPDLPGGRVMAEHEPKDKVEEEKKSKFKKTLEYRKFPKLLELVVKAPPLRRPLTSK